MRFCENCQREFPDSFKYCAACGRELGTKLHEKDEKPKYEWD